MEEKHTEIKKFNTNVLQFTDPEAVFLFKQDEDGKTNVHITAYSGKDIPHFWWGKLAIDLKGRTAKPIIPILEQHELTRKIGFTKNTEVTPDYKLVHEDMIFVDTPFAQEFQSLSKQGFPYEASIYAKPSVIEEVGEGATTEVNGRRFTGPGSIFRQWEHKETSVCVFGADKNTKAKAFEGGDEFESTVYKYSDSSNLIFEKEEVKTMDLEKMKTEDPEGYQKLMDTIKMEAAKEVEAQFKEVVSTLKLELDVAKASILEFQKNETIRAEKEIKLESEVIWTQLLSNSPIPERLYSKVKAQISYEKFVKDTIFDKPAFVEAVTKEIEDWKDVGFSASVEGFGITGKTSSGEDTIKLVENESWLKKMKGLAGQTVN
jgi:hypothetical protein